MRKNLRYLWLLYILLVGMVGSAFGQSACTAAWAVDGGKNVRYFNTLTNQWSAPILNLTALGNPNAMAVASSSGLIYVVDRTNQQLHSIDLNVLPVAQTPVGIIPSPPPSVSVTNILGNTTDAAGNLYVYATYDAAPFAPATVTVARVSSVDASVLTNWTQILTVSGAFPNLSGSGDSFIDAGGNNYILTNTNPPTLHRLDLNYTGSSFGRTNSPPLTITGADGFRTAGVATDPATGITFLGGRDSVGVGTATVTYTVDLNTGATVRLAQIDNSFTISDMGSCVNVPAKPTVTKFFSPTFRASAVPQATSTLTINLGNSNSVPVYLNRTFTDTLPAGLRVATPPSLQGTCLSNPANVITAPANSTSVTFAAEGRIPAGGCTIVFNVSTTVAGAFVNNIPAAGLYTTAGTNTLAALATFNVATRDFSITKSQRVGTAGPLTSGPISVPSGSTMQYVLEIVNNPGSPSIGTVTFTDLLPSQITPVLSVTAVEAGAGTCATVTSVVGGRTQVRGTFTAAPIGGTCTVTITAKASITAVLLSFSNTVTMGPVAPTTDASATNNNATVTTNILPGANITISKTNNTTTLITYSTTTYTITVANLVGGAAANGALVADPVRTGLSCTSVVCTASGGAVCQAAPLSLATFQTTGIPVTTFPAGSSASFVLTCLVTATGLP